MKSKIASNIEYKLNRIGEQLFLNLQEKDKLVEIYNNSSLEMRDVIVSELEEESRSKEFEVRYNLRDKIRKS